jgi:cell division protease FtsH
VADTPTQAKSSTPAPKAAAGRNLLDGLKDFEWAKLNPLALPWKKLFGPLLLVLVFVLLAVYGVVLNALEPATQGKQLSLSEVYKAATEHRVRAATFYEQDSNLVLKVADPDLVIPATAPLVPVPAPSPASSGGSGGHKAEATTTTVPAPPPTIIPGKVHTFWAAYAASDAETLQLSETIRTSGAQVFHNHQASKRTLKFIAQFLLPLLILASVFSFFFLLITGGGGGAGDFLGFSKFASKVQRRKKGTKGEITFADVAGNDESLQELQEVVDYLMNPEQFASLGARAPKGVLLCGPPGTGKTLLAKAVAGEASVPFIQLSGSEFVESLVGVGAARVRDLFRQARELAPCIIFIDELDAAGRQRGAGVGGGNDEREQTLNQLLVEMDGFATSLGIAVLGATNRPDILDPALLRPGRFDRQIVIDVPDVKGRVEILKIHMRKRPIDANVDLLQIAKQVPGFTGAELANVVNEAALLAVRSRRETITQVDLEEAVDRVLAGPERRSHVLTDEEKLVIAYHEAGHAVVARGAGQQTGVLKLSIVARGLQLGHATTYSSADRMLQLRSEIEAQLATLLGGLATERVVFGEISTGNGGDLEKATTLARKVVATWGMTDAVGRVQVLNEGQVFMGREFGSASHTSQDALNAVDAEMRRILDEAEARAERIVRANRSIVDDLAHALLERESMVGPEVDPYLARVQTLAAPMPVKELVARELRVEGMVPSRTSNGRKKPANL